MKFTNLKAFERHLDEADRKHLADLYAIIGKEAFEVKSATNKLVNLLIKSQNNSEFALKVYEASKLNVQDLTEELGALPFLSEKRVILIENAENLSKTDTLALEKYFTQLNPTLCLIISASAINRGANFYKKLEKAGIILDIAEEKSWEKEKSLKSWIIGKVQQEKKRISQEAIALLQKQIGTDQLSLHQELEKLFCFVEDEEITVQHIAEITTSMTTETGWQLASAIFSRNANEAFSIADGLLNSGTPLLALIRQLRSSVQTDYQICTILDSGGTDAEITAEFPYMKGRILENHIQAARNYGSARFKKALLKIDETESMAKNSLCSDDVLLQLLITKVLL